MAQSKQIFLSNDGKEFATEHEADAHDAARAMEATIDAYCVSAGLEKAQRGLLRKHIAGFTVFAKTYVPPTVQGVQAETADAE